MAGKRATNAQGRRATVWPRCWAAPGSFAALARKGRLEGRSKLPGRSAGPRPRRRQPRCRSARRSRPRGARSPRRRRPCWARPRTSRRGSPRAAPRSWSAGTAPARWRRSTPGAAGGLGVAAERRPHARHLVRGDGRPGAGPAADDALIGAPVRHVAGGRFARPGPVVALLVAQRAVRDRVVAAAAQLLDHGLRHARALVRGDRDLMGRQPSLEACPSCPRSRSPRAA